MAMFLRRAAMGSSKDRNQVNVSHSSVDHSGEVKGNY